MNALPLLLIVLGTFFVAYRYYRVSQLTRLPYDASLYSLGTATLATDLTNATALSGEASSCVTFDPATGYCSNFTPVGLKTNKGAFYIFEPYTDDGGVDGKQVFSVNLGVFWSELEAAKGED